MTTAEPHGFKRLFMYDVNQGNNPESNWQRKPWTKNPVIQLAMLFAVALVVYLLGFAVAAAAR